jgi:hypothetical protein
VKEAARINRPPTSSQTTSRHWVNAELQGKIAVANAKLAYARFRETFSGKRWERLAAEEYWE